MNVLRSLSAMLLVFGLASEGNAQDLRRSVEGYVDANQKRILTELWHALEIPSVASDRENIRLRAEHLEALFEKRGFETTLFETSGNPLVFAERQSPGATRTVLFYAHYDGQPVDPSKWEQENPFEPVLRGGSLEDEAPRLDFDAESRFERDWRIYARSASDDTGPIVALLAAIDALDASGTRPRSHVKVILDGEEEAGSPSLVPAIEQHRDALVADLMIILDGPLHPSGRPTIVYGARGILTVQLTVYGPKIPLHSGHYGNWAPNPAMQLAELLASMKDDEGRVVIEGFYDGIELTPADREVLDSVPDDLDGLKTVLGFSQPDAVGDSLQEALQYPSLNVRGLESAWVGDEARTIIPSSAIAAIDVRLVPETDADVMYEKLRRHVERQSYHIVDQAPDDAARAAHARIVKLDRSAGSNAFRTPLDDEGATRVVDALSEMWGASPVRIRTMGGTVPISPFIRALGFPALTVPTVNFDNNQHSPNENLRLGHFFDSVVTIAALLGL